LNRNTGKVAGAEVAQLYVHERIPVCRVPKGVERLQKSFPPAGRDSDGFHPAEKSAFEYYDDGKKSWVADDDSFEILIGSSSRDLRLRENFHPTAKKQAHAKVFNLFPRILRGTINSPAKK